MSGSDLPVHFTQKVNLDPKQLVSDELLEQKTPQETIPSRGGARATVDRVVEEGLLPDEAQDEMIEQMTGHLDDPHEPRKMHPDETDVELYRSILEGLEEPLGIHSVDLNEDFPEHVNANNIAELTEYAVLDGILDERTNFSFNAEVDPEKVGTGEVDVSLAGTKSVFITGQYGGEDEVEPGLAGLEEVYDDLDVISTLWVGEPTSKASRRWKLSIPGLVVGELERRHGAGTGKSDGFYEFHEGKKAQGTAENIRAYSELLEDLGLRNGEFDEELEDQSTETADEFEALAVYTEAENVHSPEINLENEEGERVKAKYTAPVFDVKQGLLEGCLDKIPEYALMIQEDGAQVTPGLYRELKEGYK